MSCNYYVYMHVCVIIMITKGLLEYLDLLNLYGLNYLGHTMYYYHCLVTCYRVQHIYCIVKSS